MLDVLIGGKLHKAPQQRTGKSGKPFVTCMLRTPQQDGTTLFVSVISFNTEVCRKLLALGDGDSVGLSGSMTAKTYTDGQGQTHPAADLVAHGVLTAYSVKKKRAAMQEGGNHEQE